MRWKSSCTHDGECVFPTHFVWNFVRASFFFGVFPASQAVTNSCRPPLFFHQSFNFFVRNVPLCTHNWPFNSASLQVPYIIYCINYNNDVFIRQKTRECRGSHQCERTHWKCPISYETNSWCWWWCGCFFASLDGVSCCIFSKNTGRKFSEGERKIQITSE